MKKVFMVFGLAMVSFMGLSQNSVVLLNETFNTPIFSLSNFTVQSQQSGCTPVQFEFELSQLQTYDNSPCLKIISCSSSSNSPSTGYIDFGFIPTLGLDSIQVTFNEKNNVSGYLYLQVNPGDNVWYDVAQYVGGPNNTWLDNLTTLSWVGNTDSLAFRLARTNNVITRIDNFKITGFTSTPPPPPSCDTVYVELPPILDTLYITLPPDTVFIDNFIYITDTIYIIDTVFIYNPVMPNDPLGVNNSYSNSNKRIVKVVDPIGREIPQNTPGLVIYIYSDGTTEKKYQIIN